MDECASDMIGCWSQTCIYISSFAQPNSFFSPVIYVEWISTTMRPLVRCVFVFEISNAQRVQVPGAICTSCGTIFNSCGLCCLVDFKRKHALSTFSLLPNQTPSSPPVIYVERMAFNSDASNCSLRFRVCWAVRINLANNLSTH